MTAAPLPDWAPTPPKPRLTVVPAADLDPWTHCPAPADPAAAADVYDDIYGRYRSWLGGGAGT